MDVERNAGGHDEETLRALRCAWRQVRAPSPPEDLRDADPDTRALVLRLQEAGRAVPLPAPAAHALVHRRRLRRLRRAAGWLSLAAAAVVAWFALPSRDATPPTPAEPALPVAQSDPAAAPIEVAALSSDHVELRSGPVRLVWLNSPQQVSTSDAGERR
jgi:hypothetical protein